MGKDYAASEWALYRPEPCQQCGSRVIVQGWTDVTRLDDLESRYVPVRLCTNRGCASRRGTLGDPPA